MIECNVYAVFDDFAYLVKYSVVSTAAAIPPVIQAKFLNLRCLIASARDAFSAASQARY